MNWLKRKRADYWNNKAIKHLESQDYKKAIEYFQKVQELYPNWSSPKANESLCHFELEQYFNGYKLLNEAIAIEPNNDDYLANKVYFLIRENKYKEAINISTKLISKSDNIEYLANHGFLLFSLTRYKDSIDIYNKLYSITGDLVYRLCTADSFSKLNYVDKAIKIYEDVIEIAPSSYSALNNIGYAQLKKKNYQIAINYFNKTIQVKNDFAFAYNNRGFAKLKMGNLTEAKIDIEKSLELDGKNSYAYKNLALYYIEMKNTTKALTSLNKAKDLGFKELYGNEVDELLHQINDGT